MFIQFILIAAIAVMIARLIMQFSKKRISRGEFQIFLVIWLAAVVIIGYPDLTSVLASRLGVGRGVDLAIYVSVIAIFYFLFKILMRIEKIEANITQVVREAALKEKSEDEK